MQFAMDHIWRQEAEREMTRRFTTPLLPLKLVDGSIVTGAATAQTNMPRPANAHISKSQAKAITTVQPGSTDLRNGLVETHVPAPREQTLLHRKQVPRQQSDATSRDSGIDLPTATADRSLNNQDLDKEIISQRSDTKTANSNSESAFTSQYRSKDSMRDKIAHSAAAVEDSLPFYLGYKRKDYNVRFREQADILS